MEKYLRLEKREAHPMEKYIGRLAKLRDGEFEVVGYRRAGLENEGFLIIDASQSEGWTRLDSFDIIFKECEYYWYADITDLID